MQADIRTSVRNSDVIVVYTVCRRFVGLAILLWICFLAAIIIVL